MTAKNLEKLKDYLSGLKEIRGRESFPIGAILVDETDRKEVLKNQEFNNLLVIEIDDGHPDIVLEKLAGAINSGFTALLNIGKVLPVKLMNFLISLAHGQTALNLAGHEKPIFLDPSSIEGKVVMLMNKKTYDTLELQDTISSVCRL